HGQGQDEAGADEDIEKETGDSSFELGIGIVQCAHEVPRHGSSCEISGPRRPLSCLPPGSACHRYGRTGRSAGIAVLAVVLADRPPLELAQVRGPLPPRSAVLPNLGEALLLSLARP